MILCIPLNNSNGGQSEVSDHFGHADYFGVADTLTGRLEVHWGDDLRGDTETCAPIQVLSRMGVQAVLCRQMGTGAYIRCQDLNWKVFHTDAATFADAVEAFIAGESALLPGDALCATGSGHHGHDHSAHGHTHNHASDEDYGHAGCCG